MQFGRLFARSFQRVAPVQVPSLLDSGALLVDVREPFEWREGHAPRARHIPLSELQRRIRDLPAGRQVVTVCRSGHRSARAARLLAAHGYQVFNVAGGMHGWARAGLPVVVKDGRTGRIA